MIPIPPLFAGFILQKQMSEFGIILPGEVMENRRPCMVQVGAIDPVWAAENDLEIGDLCIFQRGFLPVQQDPDGSGMLLLQLSALVCVIARKGEPYMKMLNGQCLVEVKYDNSRIIKSISDDFLFTPSDSNHEEKINECRIMCLPPEAKDFPELKQGMKAWAHHFITDENNIFQIGDKKYSRINFSSIYFVETKEGEMITVGDCNLAKKCGREKLEEMTTTGILLINDEVKVNKERTRAEMVRPSVKLKDKGYEGKDVYFIKGCDYPIKINGQEFFKIHDRFITGVINLPGDMKSAAQHGLTMDSKFMKFESGDFTVTAMKNPLFNG